MQESTARASQKAAWEKMSVMGNPPREIIAPRAGTKKPPCGGRLPRTMNLPRPGLRGRSHQPGVGDYEGDSIPFTRFKATIYRSIIQGRRRSDQRAVNQPLRPKKREKRTWWKSGFPLSIAMVPKAEFEP